MREKNQSFTGVFTALITPFKNYHIDEEAFCRLIDKQIEAGVDGVVICGTTGESPTLHYPEKIHLYELAVSRAKNKIKVIAATGNNCTSETLELSLDAAKIGVDALMIVTPYYTRPSQNGLYQHYKLINEEINLPILLYSVAKRTAVDFQDETIVKLANLPNIIGIKDSTDDLLRPERLIKNLNSLNKEFYQLCGDDINIIPYCKNGGRGIVSVAANIVPELIVKLFNLIKEQKNEEAKILHNKLIPLYEVLFCETNPTPTKYAASLMNICQNEVRLPLVIPEIISKNQIYKALQSLELIRVPVDSQELVISI